MFRGKVKFGWAVFFIVLSCFVLGHAEPQSAPATSSDAHVAREIEAAEVSFTTALTTVDLPKLDQLLTEDFTWTHTVFTEDRGERTLNIRYTAAYVGQDGGWRLAVWHNTRLAE